MVKGSIVALITPFKDDKEIDYEAIDKLLDIHLKGYINEIAKYKNYLSYDAAKKNLELVYSLVLKLQNNVMPKNILNNLFVNIF